MQNIVALVRILVIPGMIFLYQHGESATAKAEAERTKLETKLEARIATLETATAKNTVELAKRETLVYSVREYGEKMVEFQRDIAKILSRIDERTDRNSKEIATIRKRLDK